MKKYLTKKRVCAILISISMLVSAIVMIPATIAHVSAEDLYSAEEPAEYIESIILPVYDDERQGDDPPVLLPVDDERQGDDPPVLLPVDDERQGDDPPVLVPVDDEGQGDDPPVLVPVDDERQGDDSPVFDDTIYIDPDNTNDISDGDEINAGSSAIDSIYYCELYGEDICLCDICEYCEGECTCDVIDFSKLRSDVLIATDVSGANYLENIVTGNVNPTQATLFVGDANAATINAAIKAGTPVIGIIPIGFYLPRTITVPSGHNIILTSEESEYDFPLGMIMNFRHFVIEPGATLTLHKVVLAAFVSQHPLTVGANAVRGGVLVNGGTLIMEDGAEIRFNHNRSADGGGGGLTIISGEAIMNGGEIKGNRSTSGNSNYRGGGGVYVGPNGKFTMNGGLIDNNLVAAGTASDALLTGGGGVYVEGEFNFTGGTILRNRTNPVAGIEHGGGGVFVAPGGRFTMSNGVITNNTSDSVGGAVLLRDNATFNLFGGAIYGNNASISKGVTWFGGTINLRDHPIVGYNDNDDYIDRYTTTNDPNQIINIVGPVGNNARINIRDHITDIGRPDYTDDLTVIARMRADGFASARVASQFHYLNNSEAKIKWRIAARDPGNDPDFILERIPDTSRFAFLWIPDDIHFGERSLLTTNLAGPYGDATGASNVHADYASGGDNGYENWLYRFMVVNTRHDAWSMTLQTTPFVTTDGIVGAIPVALRNGEINPTPKDLTSSPVKVFSSDIKNAILVWHWTQLLYRIEAQTKTDTVVPGDYKSVFTWTLQDVP